MAESQKYLFETSFDLELDERAKSRKKPPEPTYTAAELAKAEQDGFARGRAEGAEEVRAGVEQAARRALEGIGEQLRGLFAAVESDSARHEAVALDLALRAVGKLLPEMERRHGSAEIEAVLRDCLERRRGEPRLVIRTSDAVHELVRGCTEELGQELGFEGKLVFLTEEGMGPSDVRIEWADGGVERSIETVRAEIDGILAGAFGGDERAGEAQAEDPDLQEPADARPADQEPGHGEAPAAGLQGSSADPGPPPSESTIVGAQEPPPLKQEPFHE